MAGLAPNQRPMANREVLHIGMTMFAEAQRLYGADPSLVGRADCVVLKCTRSKVDFTRVVHRSVLERVSNYFSDKLAVLDRRGAFPFPSTRMGSFAESAFQVMLEIDVASPVMDVLLKYIYTKKLAGIRNGSLIFDLYLACRKFGISDLMGPLTARGRELLEQGLMEASFFSDDLSPAEADWLFDLFDGVRIDEVKKSQWLERLEVWSAPCMLRRAVVTRVYQIFRSSGSRVASSSATRRVRPPITRASGSSWTQLRPSTIQYPNEDTFLTNINGHLLVCLANARPRSKHGEAINTRSVGCNNRLYTPEENLIHVRSWNPAGYFDEITQTLLTQTATGGDIVGICHYDHAVYFYTRHDIFAFDDRNPQSVSHVGTVADDLSLSEVVALPRHPRGHGPRFIVKSRLVNVYEMAFDDHAAGKRPEITELMILSKPMELIGEHNGLLCFLYREHGMWCYSMTNVATLESHFAYLDDCIGQVQTIYDRHVHNGFLYLLCTIDNHNRLLCALNLDLNMVAFEKPSTDLDAENIEAMIPFGNRDDIQKHSNYGMYARRLIARTT